MNRSPAGTGTTDPDDTMDMVTSSPFGGHDDSVPPCALWKDNLLRLARARLLADQVMFQGAVQAWLQVVKCTLTPAAIFKALRQSVDMNAVLTRKVTAYLEVPTDVLTRVTPWVWSAGSTPVVDVQPPDNPLQWLASMRFYMPAFQEWEHEFQQTLTSAHDVGWARGPQHTLRVRITVDLGPDLLMDHVYAPVPVPGSTDSDEDTRF